MTAVKANRCYTIDESQVNAFAKDGYDIYDADKIVKYGAGKTVTFEVYMALKEENEALKAELEELKSKPENEALKEELEELKTNKKTADKKEK